MKKMKTLLIDDNKAFVVLARHLLAGNNQIDIVGEGYDGVHIFSPDGKRIGQIVLPEVCSNVCFGGPRRNRLFMTASRSLYAVYVEAQGAHWC